MTDKQLRLITNGLHRAWLGAKTPEERFGVKLARDNILSLLEAEDVTFDTIRSLKDCGITKDGLGNLA
jgi:hypothetical protein